MPEALTPLAEQTLSYFEEAVAIAEAALAGERAPSANAFASLNTLTGSAMQTLTGISEDMRRDLEAVIAQPAIARVEVINEEGQPETIFITAGGAPRARIGDVRVASYRSPVGRLAAVPVGTEVEVKIKGEGRSYDLMGRARLRPEYRSDGWDSRNTVVERLSGPPLTVVSLRALLRSPDASEAALDLLNSLLQEDSQAANVFEGVKRARLERMGLREQPLLDQFQDEIIRLPLDRRVVILGPPGSGKTTTLIKRLGLKLDLQVLDDELGLIGRTLAGRVGHPSSWLMFSPTELLRLYLKEAFARERVPASDLQIQVWDKFRRETARNRLGILRSSTSGGAILRDSLENLQPATLDDQIAWFEDFDRWQSDTFWFELREQAERIAASPTARIASLGARLLAVVDAGAASRTAAPFHDFRSFAREVADHASALQTGIDQQLRRAFADQLRLDPQLLNKLLEFVEGLGEGAEDVDDAEVDLEEEEDDAPVPNASREMAFDAYMRAARAQARALVAGRKLGPRTRHGQILEWLGERRPPEAVLRQLGADVLLSAALRRLANPLRAFLRGVPSRYRRFRRLRLTEARWYLRVAQAPADLSPLELDVVLLAMLRAARLLLREPRLVGAIQEPALQSLRPFQELLHTQILVDEATDFSPLQLACMAALCDPAADSFFACGDFNQRITAWGSRSADELRWVFPDADVRTINVTYRHSRQLNALAHRIALLTDPAHQAAILPDHVDSDGVEPALGLEVAGDGLVAWLKARILEIEALTQTLPSIAVLVNREADVQPLADALQAALSGQNIQCVACPGGQVRGNDHDVRVFDVQHIKGLEFEAVFFVDVDELARSKPELFDKFIYVGATRAAMYLGLTTAEADLPGALGVLRDAFGQSWAGR